MDIEEKKAKLEFIQKFFVKSFWIRFLILIVSSVLCMALHGYHVAMISKYFPISLENLNLAIVLVFGIWKVLIIQFTLVPALAIWCIKKCCKCKSEQEKEQI